MAAPGKKGKTKLKGTTLNLSEFLSDEKGQSKGPGSSYVLASKNLNWAAEVEKEDFDDSTDYGMPVKPRVDRSVLPTAPRASRGSDMDMANFPQAPPYTAFLGNLSYDADEDKIMEFFSKLKVMNVRLPNENGRPRGFGYVEFADKESLMEALAMNDEMLQNRKLRVDLAGHQQQSGGGGYGDDSRSNEPDRTEGDWRRKDPEPDRAQDDRYSDRGGGYGNRDRGYGGDRSFGGDRDRGYGGDRSYGGNRDRGYGGDRGSGGYGGDRDFGGNRAGGYGGDRDRGYGNRSYDRGGQRGYDDQQGGYGNRRGFGSGYRQDDRQGGDSYGRSDDRYTRRDGPPREEDREPAERPRLQLKPRSKPAESTEDAPERKSSIFGDAKPVDTLSREMEIEERLKQKKTEERKEPKRETSRSSIFGDAKPVDTYIREREIDDRIMKAREQDHRKLEDEKENRREPWSSGGYRQRRDSDRSQDGAGGTKRERHLSSGSGKGVRHVTAPVSVSPNRSRKDSDNVSNHSDHANPDDQEDSHAQMSPRREEDTAGKIMPAPPPKENIWEVRKSTTNPTPPAATKPPERDMRNDETVSPPSNAWSRGRQNPDAPNAWRPSPDKARDGDHYDSRPAGRGSDRGGGAWGRGAGRGEAPRQKDRERPIPSSIDEMPKYEEDEKKDWSDKNKFANLPGDDDEDNNDDQ